MNILNAALHALPTILALIQSEYAAANPGAEPPSEADVLAALHTAVTSVVAKGDAWKAAHPPKAGSSGD